MTAFGYGKLKFYCTHCIKNRYVIYIYFPCIIW